MKKMIRKKCTKCGIEKENKDFYSCKTSKDKLQGVCKICWKERIKMYQKSAEGKRVMSIAQKKYWKTPKGIAVRQKFQKTVRYKNYAKIYAKNYKNSNHGKITIAKFRARRERELGFVPINRPFSNSHGHHLCETYVLYIPASLHKLFPHNHKKLETMELINEESVRWYYSLT